ncbi:hypothetical protein IWQ60_004994 [Tieghemiomyces parasiticus]|uniref:DUF1746 domain-containing protein n=1 Tax=Tieghemiomyces parasiticus TaxID=78921 RepID=A0A9W8AAE6_9FUNG|nr:hypothetical protein IWQ60_004994 [Tieghemiomyces parasiticus]
MATIPTRQEMAIYRLVQILECHLRFSFLLMYLFDKSLIFYLLRNVAARYLTIRAPSVSLRQLGLLILFANAVSIIWHAGLTPTYSLMIDFVGQSWAHVTLVLAFFNTYTLVVQLVLALVMFKAYNPAARDPAEQRESEGGDVSPSARVRPPLNQELISAILSQLARTVESHSQGTPSTSEAAETNATNLTSTTPSPNPVESPATTEPTTSLRPPVAPTTREATAPVAASEETALLNGADTIEMDPNGAPTEEDPYAPVIDLSWLTVRDLYRRSAEAYATPAENTERLPV